VEGDALLNPLLQEAFDMIEAEIGQPLERVFSSISASPIAAASLGQVYKATLAATGEEVAIKVHEESCRQSQDRIEHTLNASFNDV
jgi:predicted unusual protein kinase regulating ubiquinone biosynthesis (AarF/ABC1/UbiB family)